MSMFSRFYSASEAEAAINLCKLIPQQPEGALPSSDSDAEELSNLLNGTVVSTPRPRNDVNQPLFRVRPAGQSAGVLANEPSFAIYEERVIRDKNVGGYAGDSDESEWAARSRTPSSDQRSPQEAQAPSSASSVKGEMSSASDISNGRRETKRPGEKQMSSLGSASRYHATYPQMVLQNMDTQFSKWSYDLKEGYTAIPFVTARVPPELHRKMVENDKKYWVSGIEDLAGEQTDSQGTVKPTLEGHQNLRRFNTNILITLVAQVIGEERVIWKDVVQICCSTDGIPCWNTARREMLLAGSKLGLDVDIETVYMREAESPDKPIRNNDEFVEVIEYLTSRQYASATLVASAEVAKAATSEPVDDAASKRAAFIARNRAAKNSSLVVSKSAGQKRSALQKNKKRKPIMSSPPPTPRKQEPTTKPAQEPEQQPTQQPQQSTSTFIYLNSNAQDERREVDTALQKQSIDFESGPDMERWMHHLSKLKKARDEGRVLGEVEAPSAADGSQDGVIPGQGSKLAGRLKGKARKTAKGDSTC